MNNRWLSIFIAVVAILALQSCSEEKVTRDAEAIPQEEYRVYAAVLDHDCQHPLVRMTGLRGIDGYWVIAEVTFPQSADAADGYLSYSPAGAADSSERVPYEICKGIAPATLADWKKKNSRAWVLRQDGFDILQYRVRYAGTPLDKGSREWWEGFNARNPNARGAITFSRVGFNESSDEAFLYKAWDISVMGGSGCLYQLKKRRGTWEIENREETWVR